VDLSTISESSEACTYTCNRGVQSQANFQKAHSAFAQAYTDAALGLLEMSEEDLQAKGGIAAESVAGGTAQNQRSHSVKAKLGSPDLMANTQYRSRYLAMMTKYNKKGDRSVPPALRHHIV